MHFSCLQVGMTVEACEIAEAWRRQLVSRVPRSNTIQAWNLAEKVNSLWTRKIIVLRQYIVFVEKLPWNSSFDSLQSMKSIEGL